LIAGIFSFTLLFGLVFGANSLNGLATGYLDQLTTLEALLEYVQIYEHVGDFSRGVLDTRPIIFYLSGTLLTLSIAVLAVDHKR
jgi:ABC-2 type transport system permease protein